MLKNGNTAKPFLKWAGGKRQLLMQFIKDVNIKWGINQLKLDRTQLWLARTTEPFNDWEYDGNELIIFINAKPIEIYYSETIEEYIFND